MAGMWASGEAYEPYVGRWSRPVAGRFVGWLDPAAGSRWLDVGCGTGALTTAVLGTDPAAVLGVDRSPGFLAYARQRLASFPVASFAVADGGALPVRDAAVDRVVSGLVLNFLPDPAAAVAEMARACRPGGTVAVYVWDYAEGMQPIRLFWDAAVALDPTAAELDEGRRFGLCRPEPLAALFAELSDVDVTGITVPAVFRDFDDYWTPFLGAQGPAPAYLARLPEPDRARLRERLRATLPAGPIRLSARAYAVRGTA
jgi:SAM-dependent methyltransferase